MEDDATQNDRIGEESKQFPNGEEEEEEEEDEDAAVDFVPKPSHFLALSLSLPSANPFLRNWRAFANVLRRPIPIVSSIDDRLVFLV